jgi:hypothetical protein
MGRAAKYQQPSSFNLLIIACGCLFLLLVSCDDFGLYDELSKATDIEPLSILPAEVIVAPDGTVSFSATGGTPPYTFSIVSGTGTINAATGEFTAPSSPEITTVMVTDSGGDSSTATVTVTIPGALAIAPSSVNVVVSGTLTFVATGGTPPYTFSIIASGSGTPTINSVTGFYTAGSSTGIDTVQVEDAVLDTVTATVTVVPGPDYTVSAATMPTSGIPGAAFVGAPGLDFRILETGGNAGTLPISWRVYVSTDTLLDGGDTLADSGSIGSLGAGNFQDVTFAGTWPGSPGKNYYLLVDLTAGDDTNPVNNGYISAVISVPDSFAESEPNDSDPPPAAPGSFDDVGTLVSSQLIQITGVMDGAGYDTYRFTAGPGMTKVDIKAFWSTGINDIDLFFWQEGGGAVIASSIDPDPDTEPKLGNELKITSLTPGLNYMIGVSFVSASTQPYSVNLEGN